MEAFCGQVICAVAWSEHGPETAPCSALHAGDSVLGAISGGWCLLVSMQAALVALTLLFCLVLSHAHGHVSIHTVFLPILVFLLHICTVAPPATSDLLQGYHLCRFSYPGMLRLNSATGLCSGWEMRALVLSACKALQRQRCS